MHDSRQQFSANGLEDDVCKTLHRWEQRCFAAIKLLGAITLLALLLVLEAGLLLKAVKLEFGSAWSTETQTRKTRNFVKRVEDGIGSGATEDVKGGAK